MKHYIKIAFTLLFCFSFSSTPAAKSNLQHQREEIKEVQQLSHYDQECARFNKQSCQTLLSKLSNLCNHNNAFACFRISEIASINSEVAARKNLKKDSIAWLDIAVGSIKKACQLHLPQAYTQLSKFKSDFDAACKKGDQFFCQARKKL